jgi:hypothetical protein
VNKRFRVCDLNQPFLIAPSLQDWLPENHLARFVAEVCRVPQAFRFPVPHQEHRVPPGAPGFPPFLSRTINGGAPLFAKKLVFVF